MRVSHSGLGLYDNCPRSFKFHYITYKEVEDPREPSPQRKRGTELHEAIEAYLCYEDDVLPHVLTGFEWFFENLRAQKTCEPERRWSFDRSWEACDFEDEKGMLRGIMDAIYYDESSNTVEVYEWKTGRKYPDHVNQRALYNLAGMLLYPDAEASVCTTLYLDTGDAPWSRLDRGMVGAQKWVWQRHWAKTQPPQNYPARPNWKCRFCRWSRKNANGPCMAG